MSLDIKIYNIAWTCTLGLILFLVSCETQRVSTLIGEEYDADRNITNYFVIPYGSVEIPGKWKKTDYNPINRQQFFSNADSIRIAVAFGPLDNYEFNKNGSIKGWEFVKAFYKWDTEYYSDTYGLENETLEIDSLNSYVIYRIFGEVHGAVGDTYFLIAAKNDRISNFSISTTELWTPMQKISFLRSMYISQVPH